jgi:hypothetical protein
MLLGFIVSERVIEANPEKIAAITNMEPIKDLKGVQRVMGCLAALSRFISRLGERGLPLYRSNEHNKSLSLITKALCGVERGFDLFGVSCIECYSSCKV